MSLLLDFLGLVALIYVALVLRQASRIMSRVGCRLDSYSCSTTTGNTAVIEKLDFIISKEAQQMALGQDILDAITAQGTLIGSVKALIEGLVASGTIPPDVGAAITAKLAENSAALEAALAAGTTPPTP